MDWKLGGLIFAVAGLAGCDLNFVGDYIKVRDAKKEVAGALLDPDSADFREVELYPVPGSSYGVVCGEVNGRNAFGAKAGFQRFIYVRPLMRIGDGHESNQAIFSCCRHFASAGGPESAKSTADVPACAAIEPAMGLIL